MKNFQAKTWRAGNSSVITIPDAIRKHYGLSIGDIVKIKLPIKVIEKEKEADEKDGETESKKNQSLNNRQNRNRSSFRLHITLPPS